THTSLITIIAPSSSTFCVHSSILSTAAPAYTSLLRFPKDASVPPNTAYLLPSVPLRPFHVFLSWCYGNRHNPWGDEEDMGAGDTVRVGMIAEQTGADGLVDAVVKRLQMMPGEGVEREVVKTLFDEADDGGSKRLRKVLWGAIRRRQRREELEG